MTEIKNRLPSEAEVSAAKDVISSFLVSMKNYELYPADHSFTQNFLKNIHERLDRFLSSYGRMRIGIEQKRLLYKSVTIYEAHTSEDNFAFLLYRDGLLWIEFFAGLTIEEIKDFFAILNKYKVLHDEPEEDIVTALWDANMDHIGYEAKEVFFEDVPLLDFSALNKKAIGVSEEEKKDKSTGSDSCENDSDHGSAETGNILDMVSGGEHQQWWSLTKEEFELLRDMVQEAERRVRVENLLQVLFYVLTKQENADDFVSVLDFLKTEWRSGIEKGDFSRVVHQLSILQKLKKSPPQDRQWVAEPLKHFFENISGRDFLSSLEASVRHINGNTPEQLNMFGKFLLFLEPIAIKTLGELLLIAKDQKVLEMLYAAMLKLGKIDVAHLSDLVDHENDLVALGATQILSKIKGKEADSLIVKALDHSSPKVRRYALRSHLETGDPCLEEIFKKIDDPDLTTRSMLLSFLGSGRNEKAERLLLNYLQRLEQQSVNEDHIYNCYTALGRCGSIRSLPFLKKTLLDKGWKSMLNGGKAIQQNGAIMALSKLEVEGAKDVLRKGATSLVPAIRKSCHSALEKMRQG